MSFSCLLLNKFAGVSEQRGPGRLVYVHHVAAAVIFVDHPLAFDVVPIERVFRVEERRHQVVIPCGKQDFQVRVDAQGTRQVLTNMGSQDWPSGTVR